MPHSNISDNYKKNYNKIFNFFGLDRFEKIFKYSLIFNNLTILGLSIFYLFKCICYILLKDFNWLINDFKVKSIKIGDLIYDSYMRYDFKYVNPRINLFFLNIAFKSIFRTLKSLKLIKKYKPKIILVGTDFIVLMMV